MGRFKALLCEVLCLVLFHFFFQISSAMNQSLISSTNVITIQEASYQQYSKTHIFYAYLISGILVVTAGCCSIMNLCAITQNNLLETNQENAVEKTKSSDDCTFKIPFLIVVFLFYVSYCGLEANYVNYIATYVVEELSFSKKDGAMVTALFYMGYNFGRVCGIFLIKIMTPQAMLQLFSVLSFLSLLPLVFLSDTNPMTSWVSTAAVGLSVGPIFATAMTWSSQYVDITGKIGLIFTTAFAFGEMTVPIILSAFYGKYGMTSFVYIMLTTSCLEIFLYILLEVVVAYCRGRERDYQSIDGDCD